jgi:hypothetical protein
MGTFFETYTWINCVKNLTIDVEGKRTFISHGDEFYVNPVTRALKTPFTISAMNLFGPKLSWKIAMGVSKIMSKKKKGQNPKVKDIFREYAKEKHKEGFRRCNSCPCYPYYGLRGIMARGWQRSLSEPGDFIKKSTYIEYISDAGFQLKEYKQA